MTKKEEVFDDLTGEQSTEATIEIPAKLKDKVTIIIHKDANDPTSLVVNGAVNGVNYSIKRGVKVQVSSAILESLENAKGKAYYQNGDEMLESDVSSYAISVLG